MLFFVHECSHLDIAIFLGLPVATVSNRLHAARSKLKERMLAMLNETFKAHALPDDFANRIGRLIEARGTVVEALFDPDTLPDVLTIAISRNEFASGKYRQPRARDVVLPEQSLDFAGAQRPAWRGCATPCSAASNRSHGQTAAKRGAARHDHESPPDVSFDRRRSYQ
jgi:hypothetical protein